MKLSPGPVLFATADRAATLGLAGYALLHLVLIVALATFRSRVGGWPLNTVAMISYAAGILILGLLWTRFRGSASLTSHKSATLIVIPTFLALLLGGVFFDTNVWGADYVPYPEESGHFARLNLGMALLIVALSVATRWRGLLVAGMVAHGLAVYLNPLLWPFLFISLPGLATSMMPIGWLWLVLVPLIYLGAAFALGWRPALTAGSYALTAIYVWLWGLPFLAWHLDEWSRAGKPGRLQRAGVAVALLGVVGVLSWPYLGPSLDETLLPSAGQRMGWLGITIPDDAYGTAGAVLLALKTAGPWVLVGLALLWLSALLWSMASTGFIRCIRRFGATGWLTILGLGALVVQLPLFAIQELGGGHFAQATIFSGGLGRVPPVLCLMLGLALLSVSAAMRIQRKANRYRSLSIGATLTLAAGIALTVDIVSAANTVLPTLLTGSAYGSVLDSIGWCTTLALALLAWGLTVGLVFQLAGSHHRRPLGARAN